MMTCRRFVLVAAAVLCGPVVGACGPALIASSGCLDDADCQDDEQCKNNECIAWVGTSCRSVDLDNSGESDDAGVQLPDDGCVEQKIDGASYAICSDAQDWFDAQVVCAARGERLLVLNDTGSHADDVAEETAVLNAVRPLGFADIWLGLSDTERDGVYVWLDGAVLDFSPTGVDARFGADEPTNPAGEDCIEVKADGSWNDSPCDVVAIAFVCEEQIDPTTAVPAGCTRTKSDLGTYLVCAGPATYDEAVSFCGADAASLVNMQDNASDTTNEQEVAIVRGLTARVGSYWIGLDDKTAEGTFQWQRLGERPAVNAVLARHFGPDQPDNFGSEDCIVATIDNDWADTGCQSIHPFVCEPVP